MKSSPILTLVVALIAATGISCAGKGTRKEPAPADSDVKKSETVPLAGTFKVHRFVLDNGLRLLVVEDHTSPTLAYHTWFRVGSRDEDVGRTGLAHLFEHMMFKETKNLKDGEFDRILESAGAEGENAFTSRDYTAYVQEMPSDKLDLIAKLESDRMVNLIVNEKAFKTETEVVQNERRFRNENSPDGLMYQEIFQLGFVKHPYRWPVIGYQEDLERMTGTDAMNFYRMFYSPNHATIVIVGDVTPQKALATVTKYYGNLQAQPSPARVIEAEPPQSAPRRKNLMLNIQVQKLMIGYHIPSITDPDVPALAVMQAILTGGKSSRLSRALVDTGIVSSIDSYSLDDKDPSLFLLTANLQKGKKAAQAEAVILREFRKLQKEGVSDKELERAKNRIAFEFYQGLNSSSEKANFLGHFEAVAGNFEKGLEIQKQTQLVTAQDVLNVARKYLEPNNRNVIIGLPKGASK